MQVVGMMSGTSLDAVDAVLARFCAEKHQWQIIATSSVAIPPKLKDQLHQLNFSGALSDELHQAKSSEYYLTHCYADAYQSLLKKVPKPNRKIIAIAAHGQTIRHAPNHFPPYTYQLLNGALLSDLTQCTVVCDFRSKDIAAGGQGAPFAPLFHRELFFNGEDCAVVNIGGISNISVLASDTVTGFDCGPGNCLLDEWIMQYLQRPFDEDARWAKQGSVLPSLLNTLLLDKYFSQAFPKSTGRDYFHLTWLNSRLCGDENPVDVMRTLVQLTATCIADSVPKPVKKLVVVGGGANNPLIVDSLTQLLPKQEVYIGEQCGVDSQYVEALGFAILGRSALLRQPLDTRSITGARYPIISGAVYYN